MSEDFVLGAVGVGDAAPDFTLPGLDPARPVGLAGHRGRRKVLIGLFRGLHCPFCRRQATLLNGLAPALRESGIATIAVINTEPERARRYYRARSMAIEVGLDPEWRTHARYGLLRPKPVDGASDWPRTVNPADLGTFTVNPTGELDQPLPPIEANWALNGKDGFELDAVDQRIFEAHGMTGAGHFLVDADGVVRWAWREGEAGMASLATFPTRQQILDAVST